MLETPLNKGKSSTFFCSGFVVCGFIFTIFLRSCLNLLAGSISGLAAVRICFPENPVFGFRYTRPCNTCHAHCLCSCFLMFRSDCLWLHGFLDRPAGIPAACISVRPCNRSKSVHGSFPVFCGRPALHQSSSLES